MYVAKVTSVKCMLPRLHVYNVYCQEYKCIMYVAKVILEYNVCCYDYNYILYDAKVTSV